MKPWRRDSMNKSKKSIQVSPVPRNTRISGGGSKKLQVCVIYNSSFSSLLSFRALLPCTRKFLLQIMIPVTLRVLEKFSSTDARTSDLGRPVVVLV